MATVDVVSPIIETAQPIESLLQNRTVDSRTELLKDTAAQDQNPAVYNTIQQAQDPLGNTNITYGDYAGKNGYCYGGYNPSEHIGGGFDAQNYFPGVQNDNGAMVYYTSAYGYPHQPSYNPHPSYCGQNFGPHNGYQYATAPMYHCPDMQYYGPPYGVGQETPLATGVKKLGNRASQNPNAVDSQNPNMGPKHGFPGLFVPPPPVPPHVAGDGNHLGFPTSGYPPFYGRGELPPPMMNQHGKFQPPNQKGLAYGFNSSMKYEGNGRRRQMPLRVASHPNNNVKKGNIPSNFKFVKAGTKQQDASVARQVIKTPANLDGNLQKARVDTSVCLQSSANGNSAPANKVPTSSSIDRSQYNKDDFMTSYEEGKCFIIKSYSEDDVHKSIKYGVWSSTPNGNKKLDKAYQEAQGIVAEHGQAQCPIFLFFSVNCSGQFCGVAEMTGNVDFDKDMDFWFEGKWTGCFPVKWHIVKDVPNHQLRRIVLPNNENKPVTHSRDTQEITIKQGCEMLTIFKNYPTKTSLLDDFAFYDNRQRVLQEIKQKQQVYEQVNRSSNKIYRPSNTKAELYEDKENGKPKVQKANRSDKMAYKPVVSKAEPGKENGKPVADGVNSLNKASSTKGVETVSELVNRALPSDVNSAAEGSSPTKLPSKSDPKSYLGLDTEKELPVVARSVSYRKALLESIKRTDDVVEKSPLE